MGTSLISQIYFYVQTLKYENMLIILIQPTGYRFNNNNINIQ